MRLALALSFAILAACEPRSGTGSRPAPSTPAQASDPATQPEAAVPDELPVEQPCFWRIEIVPGKASFEGTAGLVFDDTGGEVFSVRKGSEVRFAGVLSPLDDSQERARIPVELNLTCDFRWCGETKGTFVENGDDPDHEGYEIFTAVLGFDRLMQRPVRLHVSCPGEED